MNKKKVKDVNIYISYADKAELNKIKYKYHLSYSTIANILVNYLCMPCKLDITDKYIYEEKQKYKTHIRPRDSQYHDKTRFIYTNAIKIYVKKDLKNYIDERKEQSILAKIQHEFEITNDDHWDGNEFNKRIVRWIKKNKEYANKILEEN